MIFSFLNIIRLIFFIFVSASMMLLGSELFFIVTNSDATAEYRNEPPQNLSSGLFNSWVNEDSDEYQKMKAKGAVMLDLDWDNDLDLYFGFNNSYMFENINGVFANITDSSDIDTNGLIGVVAGDVDNNGYPDIIKQRSNLRRLIIAADNISKVAKESDASGSDRIIDEAEEKLLKRTGENLNAELRICSSVPVNPSPLSPEI